MRNNTVLRRTAGLILILILTSTAFVTGFAQDSNNALRTFTTAINIQRVEKNIDVNADNINFSSNLKAGDDAWVIVRVGGDSVAERHSALSAKNAPLSVRDYAVSSDGSAYATQLLHTQFAVQERILRELDVTYKYNYTTLINGFAAKIKYGDISRLCKIPGVQSVIIGEEYERLSPEDAVTNPVVIDPTTGIYDASESGYDGTGTVVAVLDTGLEYNHSAFSQMPSELALSKADVDRVLPGLEATFMAEWIYDEFNQEYYRGERRLTVEDFYVNDKVPFAYDYAHNKSSVIPRDSHGTHVSGIIAGKDDRIQGVAPGAQIAFFKVFDSDMGSLNTVDLIAALSDAVTLDVDVINMSLGATAGFASASDMDAVEDVYETIRESGINLVVAVGNENNSAIGSIYGDAPLMTNPDSGVVGSPSSYAASLGVGSISGVKTRYLMANGSTPVYLSTFASDYEKVVPFVEPILGANATLSKAYVTVPGVGRASDFNRVNVSGKIALVSRGSTSFEQKVINAMESGAIGCIIYNNVSGMTSNTIGKVKDFPVAFINMDTGKQLATRAEGTLDFSNEYYAGPFISDFSSWGPLPNLELKPEIMAHGGEITSAVSGGYSQDSGTSMAAPNMAGVITIIRQYINENFPEFDHKERAALANRLAMSTATIARNEEGNPYSPRKQGAGLADVMKAITAGAYISVDGIDMSKLSLGDDKNKTGVYNLEFKVHNLTGEAKSYRINPSVFTEAISSDEKTVALKAYMLSAGHSALIDGKSVTNGRFTVAPFSEVSVSVRITLTAADKKYLEKFENGMYVEGFVRLDGEFGAVGLNIPYLAFYGDWTSAPLFDASIYQIAEEQRDLSIREQDKVKATVQASRLVGTMSYQGQTGEVELGKYSLRTDDEDAVPQPAYDKIAISQNPNAVYELSGFSTGLLRGARSVDYSVSSKISGQTILTGTQEFVRKTYNRGGTFLKSGIYATLNVNASSGEYRLAGNTSYALDLTGYVDYPGEQNTQNNTFGASVFIDNDAPILMENSTNLRIEERGGVKQYFLDLYVFDNHYSQGFTLFTYKDYDSATGFTDLTQMMVNPIPIESEKNGISYVSYEITDYWQKITKNGEKLFMQFYDWALNESQYMITLPRVNATELAFTNPHNTRTVRTNQLIDLKTQLTAIPDTAAGWLWGLDWTSSDEAVAKVYDGEVFGLSPGRTTITVVSGSAKASVAVEVLDGDPVDARLTELKMSDVNLNVTQGDEGVLTVDLLPWTLSDSAAQNLVWTSGNTDIISITQRGDDPRKADFVIKDGSDFPVSVTVSNGINGSISATCTFTIKKMFEVEGKTLTRYNGRGSTLEATKGLVVFPDNLDIIGVNTTAFAGNPYITKVIIPDAIETLGFGAFAMCENLREVEIGENSALKSIDMFCFYSTPALETINTRNVKSINGYAFSDSAIQSITMPEALYVGSGAFMNTFNLKQDMDLRNVKYVDFQAFYNSGITGVVFGEKTEIAEGAFYGCLGLTSLILPFEFIPDMAFYGCTSLKSVIFTSRVRIDYGAFSNNSALESVLFKEGCISIGSGAFKGANISTLILPDGLTTLGRGAFSNCTNLKEVIISSGVKLTELQPSVFAGCDKLSGFTVEQNNPYFATDSQGILYDATMTTVLLAPPRLNSTTVVLPDSVKTIGKGAFSYTNILSIDLNNVETIGDSAFLFANDFTNIILSKQTNFKVRSIENAAFQGCEKLMIFVTRYDGTNTFFDLSPDLEYIGDNAFHNCRYAVAGQTIVLNLPSKLTYIGEYAFYNNVSIGSMRLPSSLSHIGMRAFYQCVNLQTVTFDGSPSLSYIGLGAFGNCYALRRFGTETSGNISRFPQSLRFVSAFAFHNSALTHVVLSDYVETYQNSIFNQCHSLVSLTLPQTMTKVPDGLAEYCTALISIVLPESVIAIDHYAFQGCTALTTINLDNIESIGWYSFGETAISQFEAPKLKIIPSMAFVTLNVQENTRLKYVYAPSATWVMDNAFYLCTALEEVNINSAAEVGSQAFLYCISLNKLHMQSVRTIGSAAFGYVALTQFNLPATLERVASDAFIMMPYIKAIYVDKDNKNFFSDDGVLYSYFNGGYQLECFPLWKPVTSYTVLDGTIRIQEGAFSFNRYLYDVSFPRTLTHIGDSAFYGAFNLYVFRFSSVKAPVLEYYTTIFTTDSYEYALPYGYFNFVDYLGSDWGAMFEIDGTLIYLYRPLVMVYPTNGLGYDNPIYDWYFYSKLPGSIAVEDITAAAIEAISTIPAALTLDDKSIIDAAWTAYNAVSHDQRSLVHNYSALENATAEYQKLLASTNAGVVVAMIDALPETIRIKNKDEIVKARAAFDALSDDERALVANHQLLLDAEKAVARRTGLLTVGILVGASLVGAGSYIAWIIINKKKSKLGKEAK